jgi:hypothetical protein
MPQTTKRRGELLASLFRIQKALGSNFGVRISYHGSLFVVNLSPSRQILGQ